jgi:hypothetical protein
MADRPIRASTPAGDLADDAFTNALPRHDLVKAAQDFTGAPVASVHLPARIPLGFHGSWIPST